MQANFRGLTCLAASAHGLRREPLQNNRKAMNESRHLERQSMRRLTLGVCLLALNCCAADARAQTTWAEQLGFPAGKRVVILHANDMGIAYECNRPAEHALTNGPLTSASVISAGPWFAECAEWAKHNPNQDLGISLAFLSPSPAVKWGSVAPRSEVPSLSDINGYFPATAARFLARADAEQVRREAIAQIQRAQSMGIQPTHLHPHLGTILARPDLLRVYLDLAEELQIPAVMVEFTPDLCERFAKLGIPMDDETLAIVSQYRLPKIDDIMNVPSADSYAEKRQQFFALFDEMKPGITQVFLHPSDDSLGMRRANNQWQDRVWEAKLMADAEVQQFLKKQDIVFTNWREIMQRFQTMKKKQADDSP